MTVVFVANTHCSLPTCNMINSQKVKASDKNSISGLQTQPRTRLRHSLVRASSMTISGSPCYTSIIHGFSSLTSRILFWALLHCFPDFIVIGFGPGLVRRAHFLQDEFWGFTCNLPLKSAEIVIFKFHRVV